MSQFLAWIGLVLVASTTAYGVQLTGAAMLPTAAAASLPTADKSTRDVLIIAIDPVTGDRVQVECHAAASAFASDVVLVDAKDFPAAAQACVTAGALVARS
jgi:hypothetical protein